MHKLIWSKKHLFISKKEILEIKDVAFSLFQYEINIIGKKDFFFMLQHIYIPFAAWIAQKHKSHSRTLVIGINGAQGSGKSTLCSIVTQILNIKYNLKTAILSIDDIYKTKKERINLAKTVHPLLKTRGVPGTHDTKLGMRMIERLKNLSCGNSVLVPRFDKSVDDKYPENKWEKYKGKIDIVFFEGWCMGAKPEPEKKLKLPINELERTMDTSCIWRRYVNSMLANEYQNLFSYIDFLIMLKVPGKEKIIEWRWKQEQELIDSYNNKSIKKKNIVLQSKQETSEFFMHYERLTKHMLDEIPDRADIILFVNNNHCIDKVSFKNTK